jgi:hypothetical protein
MSKGEKKSPAEKRAETKDRKKRAMLENLGVDSNQKPKKVKRKRKPMTEEQRAAAIERLAIARSKRKPAKNSSIHPDVLALEDDHPLSAENVKEWLKYNKDHLKAIKAQADSKDTKDRAEFQIVTAYVKNLGVYLKDNVWCDHRYGKLMEKPIKTICHALSYDENGNPKRTIGTHYPDVGEVWTKEMQEEENKNVGN